LPGLSDSKRRQLQEIADLMDDIHVTLAKMQCIPPEAIHRPPHQNPSINLNLAAKFNLDPSIIYLHQILPYVDKRAVEASASSLAATLLICRILKTLSRAAIPSTQMMRPT
jgi:hypothetical protein